MQQLLRNLIIGTKWDSNFSIILNAYVSPGENLIFSKNGSQQKCLNTPLSKKIDLIHQSIPKQIY